MDAFKQVFQVDQTSQHITATQLEALITDTATGDLLLLENIIHGTFGHKAGVLKHVPGVKYKLELRGQTDATFRVKLNEAYPLRQVIHNINKNLTTNE